MLSADAHMLSISVSQVKNALIDASLRTHETLAKEHCKYASPFSIFCVQEPNSSSFRYKVIYQSISNDIFLK